MPQNQADLIAQLLQALNDLAYEVQGEVEHIGSEAKHAHERALAAIAKAEGR